MYTYSKTCRQYNALSKVLIIMKKLIGEEGWWILMRNSREYASRITASLQTSWPIYSKNILLVSELVVDILKILRNTRVYTKNVPILTWIWTDSILFLRVGQSGTALRCFEIFLVVDFNEVEQENKNFAFIWWFFISFPSAERRAKREGNHGYRIPSQRSTAVAP